MKKIIKRVSIIGLISISTICAKNQGVVTSSQSNGAKVSQNKRIINNFKKIDELFASINKKINNIDKLKRDIKKMMANHDNEVICSTIDSLDRDIVKLENEIVKVKEASSKKRLQDKLEEHKIVRDREKANLNYKCEKL